MTYEIKIRETWVEVTKDVCLSWSGERRIIDGIPYQGRVYYLGTDKNY